MADRFAPPPYALLVLRRLEQAGFEAWFVGGCVRDSLLGRAPGDWDVATSARPEQVQACFQGFSTADVGARHGTILVGVEGHPVEVTTFRRDGAYSDSRHPDGVTFSPRLEEDLCRRDFTVNAMAWHPERGLRDCFGGRVDLERRVLRCVGDPARRLPEDALRVLRCLRFAAVLGFSIQRGTAQALWEHQGLLPGLSAERVREELTKLLCGERAPQVLREYSGIIFTLLPELVPMCGCTQETPYHCYTVWEHTLHALGHAPQNATLRWAAFLHDSGKPGAKFFSPDGVAHFYGHAGLSEQLAQGLLARLRFPNKERERVCSLIGAHSQGLPFSEKRVKKLLGKQGEEWFFQLLDLMAADNSGKQPDLCPPRLALIGEARELAQSILAQGACLTLKGLAVKGNDLLALGYAPGPGLGAALQALLDLVVAGEIPNEKGALEKRALALKEEKSRHSAP